MLREYARFSVPSRVFPNSSHVWEVNAFVLRGSNRISDDALNAIARFVYPLTRTFTRMIEDTKQGLSSIPRGCKTLINLVLGTPRYIPIQHKNLYHLEKKRRVLSDFQVSIWKSRNISKTEQQRVPAELMRQTISNTSQVRRV